MTDGTKLSALPALGAAAAPTDLIYLVRGSSAYRALVSNLRLLIAQISDSGVTGRALVAATDAAAARLVLGLGTLAVGSSIGTSDIAAAAVTLAKLADLANNSIIIGNGSNRPVAQLLSTAIINLLAASDAAGARTAIGLGILSAIADVTDTQSAAYTGIDNTQVGSVYAKLADLNALRVSTEAVLASNNLILARLRSLSLISP